MTLEQSPDRPETTGKVVELSSFRKKKETQEELSRGREPLFQSHLKDSGKGVSKKDAQADFGDRLTRIRSSLDKINKLMSELKKMSTAAEQQETRPSGSKTLN